MLKSTGEGIYRDQFHRLWKPHAQRDAWPDPTGLGKGC